MKLLIWDFDGTLGYREENFKTAWSTTAKEILQEHHSEVPYSGGLLSSGFPWHTWENPHENQHPDAYWSQIEQVYHQLFETLGLKEQALTLSKKVRGQFCDVNRWHSYPDSAHVLEALSQKGYVHVMLSNHVPELSTIVDHLGLGGFFDHIFNSGITGFEKPHPESYQMVLRKYPQAETVTMLGDNRKADVIEPGKHGIRGILVRAVDTELPCVPGLNHLLQGVL
ncbi:HAD family hydrolase [Deinococcus cellulosilyticus]|uniref:Uncharacterized protein n=1 Tax=Deinococcus cellulosilyticus (strain DSM 18568 / NBRC 106333 / KACC 11606 / 5516J-15) TaxID=1223518 RepID=A0A511N6X7_DEIC1|nr:HAD family hydrolase [Deinococcus cellulosilyticus]GEM48228.1 hypothetical protein DC3_38630 [Deinococcus cellulosilyticus NBRC 106333 = KACC 11606]